MDGGCRNYGVDAQLVDMITEMHRDTWFATRPIKSDVARTFTGVRPGNPLADTGFVMVFAHVAGVVHSRPEAEGLLH